MKLNLNLKHTLLKNYLEQEVRKENSKLKDSISGIQYMYDLELSIYTKNQKGEIIKSEDKIILC